MKGLGHEFKIEIPADVAAFCRLNGIDLSKMRKTVEVDIIESEVYPPHQEKRFPKSFTAFVNYTFCRKNESRIFYPPKSFGDRYVKSFTHSPADYSVGYVVLNKGKGLAKRPGRKPTKRLVVVTGRR